MDQNTLKNVVMTFMLVQKVQLFIDYPSLHWLQVLQLYWVWFSTPFFTNDKLMQVMLEYRVAKCIEEMKNEKKTEL